jgi:hypothetical protein
MKPPWGFPLPRHPGQRYDLPSSRVLSRALRYVRQLAAVLPPAGAPESGQAMAQTWVSDLVWFRLAEDREMLPPRFFPDHAEGLPALLAEWNKSVGFPLFHPDFYSNLDDGKERLLAWDRELHRRKFWPKGMPIALLGLLAQILPQGSRSAGRSYTPAAIRERLLDWALAPWLLKPGRPFTLLDPACGTGFFLLGALKRMIAKEEEAFRARTPLFFGPSGRPILSSVRRFELFREHLFGLEADEEALAVARRALFLVLLEGESLLQGTIPPGRALLSNLRSGDGLVDRTIALQEDLFRAGGRAKIQPFFWSDPEQGFGRVLSRGGFSAVVGNPPWAALKGKRRRPGYPPEVVAYLIRRYQASSSRPSLFELYLRRSLEFLAPDGIQAFLVPARMVSSPQFAGLRRFLREQGEVLNLHYGEPFPGVPTATVCYRFKKTARPRKTYAIKVSDAKGRTSSLPLRKFCAPEFAAKLKPRELELEPILKKIEAAGKKPLGEFLESGVGLIARPGKLFAHRQSPAQRGVVRGEHVRRYFRQGKSYLEFTARNLAGGTRQLQKLTRRDRILVRKTGARLAATLDDSGDLVEQSLYFLHLRERRLCRGYDLRYFLGILNSRVMSFYFRFRLAERPGVSPQLRKAHLDRLPIPALRRRDAAHFERHRQLVEAVERRLQAGEAAEPELDAAIERRVAHLYGLEEKAFARIQKSLTEPDA